MKNILRGLVAAVALTASAPFAGVSPAQAQSSATVTVDNSRAVPVEVYFQGEFFDTRIGVVTAHSTAVLKLPPYLDDGQTIQLFVHPESGFDLASQDLVITPGKNFDVLVPSNDNGYVAPPPRPTIPDPGLGATTATVKNERDVPVEVFVEHGDFDLRIGTVPPNHESTLAIPKFIAEERQDIDIFVHPEGGFDLSSQTFSLASEPHILITVPRM